MITFKTFLRESDDEPSEPGSRPIPDGRVRRFHNTHIDNIPSIKKHGILVSKSKKNHMTGDGIYSHDNFHAHAKFINNENQPHKSVIEFHDDPKHYTEKHGGLTFMRGKKSAGTGMSKHDVPPENIIAIHHSHHPAFQIKTKKK